MKVNDQKIFELENLFRRVFRKMRNELRSTMGKYVSINEFAVLKNMKEGAVKASDLSKALDVSASHITTITDSLFEKELITRQRSAKDRRVVHLSLTDQGKELIVKIESLKSEYFKELFHLWTDNEVDDMIELFSKLDFTIDGHE
ncbi:MarR family winged helix-turn-helix transcriptional regulator [Falsibacillus pallidus]|uniref:DNA-binding MarR family transcriptional regulator n=1 Tax=Falsibacillus pallidus TaxID=493781 RepID=A0A370GIS3_9BACI|nr:MarR family transcriptional regulator [Falsibacillus pallidus]RDI43109.1 DNA-binding MarR family transcriptional regulator [Falsibacillus pallidus]